jgi:RNA polymerase sigma-70 factor, ECF subfamily
MDMKATETIPHLSRAPEAVAYTDRDLETFAVWIKLYWLKAYALALAYLRNHADAEDVSQEAFLRAFNRIRALRQRPESFKSWLMTVVANLAKNRIRFRRVREKTAFFLDAAEPDGHRIPELSESRVNGNGHAERLAEAVAALPERQRCAVELKFFHGYKISEIARIMGLAGGTVKAHLFRGMMGLKKNLRGDVS